MFEPLVSGNVEGGKRENNRHTLDLWRNYMIFGASTDGDMGTSRCQQIDGEEKEKDSVCGPLGLQFWPIPYPLVGSNIWECTLALTLKVPKNALPSGNQTLQWQVPD